jgi:hypothetical protein
MMSQKNDDVKTCAALIVAAPFLVAALVLLAALNGWVLHVLWGWFVTPTFGVAAPSVAMCLGLGLTANLFIHTGDSTKEKAWWKPLLEGFLRAVVVLGVGYIVHLCA